MIKAGQIWRGKGRGRGYRVKVLSARKGKRVSLERIEGGPVGNVIRVNPEQLTAAYERVETES